MWKLELPFNQIVNLNYTMNTTIPQDKLLSLTIDGSKMLKNDKGFNVPGIASPRVGKCITDVQIVVSIYHPCINQLKISLKGPGGITGDYFIAVYSCCYYCIACVGYDSRLVI